MLTLASASNASTGPVNVTSGMVDFRGGGSKNASAMVTVAAGAGIALGVGAGSFTTTDIDNLFSGTSAGNTVGVTTAATSNIGVDTTAASVTYNTPLTTSKGLFKLGANTLTLGGNNSAAPGNIYVGGGALQVTSPNNFTAGTLTLGSYATTTNATLDLRNDVSTDFLKPITLVGLAASTYTINVDQAVGGSGANGVHTIPSISQIQPNNRTVTVTGANGYGLTVGTLNLAPTTGQNTTFTANVPTTINSVVNPMTGFGAGNFDTLTLSGSATGTVVGPIPDAAGGSATAGGLTRLSKGGGGTWTVPDNSTFGGLVSILQGTLNVSSINSVSGAASSALGRPTTAANGTIGLGSTTTTGN